MAISNAQLAQKMNEILTFFDAREIELTDWMNGTVGGGDNLDGTYVLTDRQGISTYVKAPAQLEDDVSGLVTSADVSATAAQAAQTAAELAETNAETAETNALGYRDAALTAQGVAEAEALAAANSAAAALANRILTDNNAATTAADTVLTQADAVLTAADVISSAASAAEAAASAASAASNAMAHFQDNGLAGETLYNTSVVLASESSGIRVYPETGDVPLIRFFTSAGVELGQIKGNSGSYGLHINSIVDSQIITLSSRNASSTLTAIAQFDPDDVSMTMGSALGDRIALYGIIGDSGMYGLGVESNTLYYKSISNHRWYVAKNADGLPSMSLSANGQLSLGDDITSGVEGGQINLLGAPTYVDWGVENYQGTLRLIGDGVVNTTFSTNASGAALMAINAADARDKAVQMGRSSTQHVSFWGNSAGNRIDSIGSTTATKPLIVNVTTDSSNNTGTAVPSFILRIMGTAELQVSQDELYLDTRRAITWSDNYLRLNNYSEFTNGVYTPGILRADGGFRTDASGYSVDTSGVRGITAVTGSYGTIQTFGAGAGSLEGYSIDGRAVFMHDGASTTGLFNDVNNQWLCTGTHAGEFTLYHAGSSRLTTTTDFVKKYGAGGALYHANASNTNGKVTVSTNGPSGGTNGDIWLEY